MKLCFMKVTLLALLAGVTLSAGAKPSEVHKRWEGIAAASDHNGVLVIAARGFAGRVVQPRVDNPISCAKPKGA